MADHEVDAQFGESLLTGGVSGSGIRARACKRCGDLVLDDPSALSSHADRDDQIDALLGLST